MAAVQSRASVGGNWLSWILLAAVLVGPPLAGALSGRWGRSIGMGAGVPLALLWWGLLLASVVQQNHRASKLVPRFAERSLRVLALAYLAIAAVLALLFACTGAPVLLTLVIVCPVLTYFATIMVVPVMGYLSCAMPFMPAVLSWVAPGLPELLLSEGRLAAADVVFCVSWGMPCCGVCRALRGQCAAKVGARPGRPGGLRRDAMRSLVRDGARLAARTGRLLGGDQPAYPGAGVRPRRQRHGGSAPAAGWLSGHGRRRDGLA
ncbi:hypothetical protein F2P44_17340 [Massilia sp. CCM 8695]|uniref:Uncharacterized protein n=1 Tax=Massilia frigida TaxID=2609281 RepID=A0ABX0N734_9BURK|nr:hypothetical protein [Massilia frigida]NHZ81024.1 hypothetical protein [Massilia frigida]